MTDANLATVEPLADQALPIGTTLSGEQFTITQQLGAGGFGITYKAQDNVLGRTIVIKECFPQDICFRSGRDVVARSKNLADPFRSVVSMFMREARSLAKLRHPNIVGVHRAFEENDTAYMVLDLIDGRDLFDILDTGDPPLSPGRVRDILLQMLDAIEKVHELDLLHRDISPDNIIIEKNGTPVLIDFGAARGDASRHTRAISSLLVVKDGYSPQEFYVAGSEQAPCSDLYALAATFYHVLNDRAPPNSQSRMIEIAGKKPDPCEPLSGRIPGYDPAFLDAIDQAMQIHPGDRIQSAAKWRSLIADSGPSAAPVANKRPKSKDVSLELETSLTRLVEETNDEVRRISQAATKPKAAPPPRPEKTEKPAWVDEFNRESLSHPREPFVDEDAPDDWVVSETSSPALSSSMRASASRPAPKSTQPETNWIDRAHEKQERIRSEQELALENYELSASRNMQSSQVVTSVSLTSETGEDEPETKAGGRRKTLPVGLVLALLVCVYAVLSTAGP